jgi:uncharacterized membrane protein
MALSIGAVPSVLAPVAKINSSTESASEGLTPTIIKKDTTMTAKKKSNRETREAKKAVVMNASKKRPIPIVIVTVVAIVVAAGLGLFLLPTDEGSSKPVAIDNQDRFTYAVSLFDDGEARHFSFADAQSNTTIRYFILKRADGVIRAAFDACDVCWPEGKGYVQDGDVMICRNCGRRFASVKVNVVQGGCNPAPLNRAVEGDQVVILANDLRRGQGYFNFSKKG